MVYSPRVMVYNTGSITTVSTGSADYYTTHAITGRIVKVAVLTANAGSMTMTESGTNETVLVKAIASGTNYSVYYPRTNVCQNTGSALIGASGNVWQDMATNHKLRIQHDAGSAAAGISFTNVFIYYT